MKRNFTLLSFLLLMTGSLFAQIPNGSISQDFTGTDINGMTHTLYADYIDQGKSVILDLSAAWCGPCWTYHEAGLLKDIYTAYGPDGTDELAVIFVESESTNTAAQLTGTSTGTSRANYTEGDWVTGTPYPIIDDATIAPLYNLSFYPTVMVVRANSGKTLQSYDNDFPITSDFMAYAARNTAENDVLIQGRVDGGNESGCSEVNPSLSVFNMGTNEVTSFTVEMKDMSGTVLNSVDWTGSIGVFETASVDFSTTILSGSMDVEFSVVNPNGMTDNVDLLNSATLTYQLIDREAEEIDESFEDQTEDFADPMNFLINAPAGGLTAALNGQAFETPPADPVGAYGLSDFTLWVNFYQWNPADAPGPMTITSVNNLDLTSVTNGVLYLDRAAAMYTGGTSDRMDIQFRDGCDGTWTDVDSKSGATLATVGAIEPFYIPSPADWVSDTIDISAYDGMEDVQMRFRFTSNYGNNLYIDNVQTGSGMISAVQEVEALNSLSIYPNPVQDVLNVDFDLNTAEDLKIDLTNVMGQQVMTFNESSFRAGNHSLTQDISDLPNGMYFVTFRKENQVSVQKITIAH